MTLTKRQKMLSAVFLIGVVGLVADRTILRPQGGPQTASADSGSVSPSAAAAPDHLPAADSTPARASLAEHLNNLLPARAMGPNDLRDPFCLPANWSETAPEKGPRPPDALQGFRQRHQLKAIVMRGGQSCAQVDDSVLVPGQALDSFTLISVDARSAVFERDGKQAVLMLVGEEGPNDR
jgi:hypothetical protein